VEEDEDEDTEGDQTTRVQGSCYTHLSRVLC
jgi:hypothetical protein